MKYAEVVTTDRLIYCDFLNPGTDFESRIYEEAPPIAELQKLVDEYLDDYNQQFVPMNLVMFGDAIHHVAKIARVIAKPLGNCLLLGVGEQPLDVLQHLALLRLGEQRLVLVEDRLRAVLVARVPHAVRPAARAVRLLGHRELGDVEVGLLAVDVEELARPREPLRVLPLHVRQAPPRVRLELAEQLDVARLPPHVGERLLAQQVELHLLRRHRVDEQPRRDVVGRRRAVVVVALDPLRLRRAGASQGDGSRGPTHLEAPRPLRHRAREASVHEKSKITTQSSETSGRG